MLATVVLTFLLFISCRFDDNNVIATIVLTDILYTMQEGIWSSGCWMRPPDGTSCCSLGMGNDYIRDISDTIK